MPDVRGANAEIDVPDELPSHALRDDGQGRWRQTGRDHRRREQPGQQGRALHARQGSAQNRRQSGAAAEPAHPRGTRLRPVARGQLGRGPGPDCREHAPGRARGGRPLARPRQCRQRLRRRREARTDGAFCQSLRLSALERGDDLLGARRVRAGPDRCARYLDERGYGRKLADDPLVGRQHRTSRPTPPRISTRPSAGGQESWR